MSIPFRTGTVVAFYCNKSIFIDTKKIFCTTVSPLHIGLPRNMNYRYTVLRDAGEGGQEGASAPPAFWLGEQGEQERPR